MAYFIEELTPTPKYNNFLKSGANKNKKIADGIVDILVFIEKHIEEEQKAYDSLKHHLESINDKKSVYSELKPLLLHRDKLKHFIERFEHKNMSYSNVMGDLTKIIVENDPSQKIEWVKYQKMLEKKKNLNAMTSDLESINVDNDNIEQLNIMSKKLHALQKKTQEELKNKDNIIKSLSNNLKTVVKKHREEEDKRLDEILNKLKLLEDTANESLTDSNKQMSELMMLQEKYTDEKSGEFAKKAIQNTSRNVE